MHPYQETNDKPTRVSGKSKKEAEKYKPTRESEKPDKKPMISSTRISRKES